MTVMSNDKVYSLYRGGGEISYFIFSYIYEEGKIDITDTAIETQLVTKILSS
jgi:hypothetical protein